MHQARTIEVVEHGEEAVVSKEACVKEEVVIRKDVDQRMQTVFEEVRRTEVDLDDSRKVGSPKSMPGEARSAGLNPDSRGRMRSHAPLPSSDERECAWPARFRAREGVASTLRTD